MSIRILLADDHTLLRECVRLSFESRSGFRVVGEAHDCASMLRKVKEHSPDVVVMDANLPGDNGTSTVAHLQGLDQSVKVIALADTLNRQTVLEMMKAHVAGYLPKICSYAELEYAINAVMAGQVYLSSHIAGHVVDGFLQTKDSALSRLTEREREILQLLAEGNAVKEIAMTLHISIKTVNTHRRQIMLKLKLRNVAELIKFSMREGLIR